MAVAVADFLVRFPAFEDVPPSTVEVQLNDAWSMFDQASFVNSVTHSRAVMLLAAHHLTLMGVGNTSEASVIGQGFSLDTVQSVSDGTISVGLRGPSQDVSVSFFGATSYGRELTKLIRSAVTPIVVAQDVIVRL